MWKPLGLVLAVGVCLLADATAQSPSGLIVGQVVDASSGKPVPGVMVTLASGTPPPQRVMADDSGGFVFTNLAAGRYALTTTNGGFADGAYGQRRPNGPSLPLELRADERVGGVTIRMWKFAAITGIVTDEASEPIVGATVRALRQVFVAGRRRLGVEITTMTDDRGMYRLGSLLPGSYVVAVPSNTLVPPPLGNDGRLVAYTNAFSPDITAGYTPASAITLGSGEVRSGVDLHPRLVPAVRVSGTLTGPDGAVPMQALQLSPVAMAEDLLGETGFNAPAATTDRVGAFVIEGVPSGQYVLRANKSPRPGARPVAGAATGPPPAPTEPTLWAAEPVVVGAEDLKITVTMRPGLRVSGRFVFEGTAPKPAADRLRQIPVTVERVDGRPTVTTGFLPPGQSDDRGAFTTNGLPGGRYVVRIGGPPSGWVFKSATLDGKDVADSGFDLKSDVADIVITFTDQVTTISGRVQTPAGPADPNATALLFPTDPAGWQDFGLNPRLLRSVRSGADGSYAFSGVPSGDYFVVAIPDEAAAEWREPVFLEALSRLAKRVHLADGDKLTQDLRTAVVR